MTVETEPKAETTVPSESPNEQAGFRGAVEKNFDQLKREFGFWLIDPDRQGTQAEWARTHDLDPNRLSEWKRHSKDVIAITDTWKVEARRGAYELGQAVRKRILATGDPAAYRAYMESVGDYETKSTLTVENDPYLAVLKEIADAKGQK